MGLLAMMQRTATRQALIDRLLEVPPARRSDE